jgi:RimJ/RimL family protein N-acetyltransferase
LGFFWTNLQGLIVVENSHFTRINTPRLRIRRFQERDGTTLAAYRNDPQVARYQSWTGLTIAEAQRFIHSLEKAEPGKPGEWFQFALELNDTGIHCGDIGLYTQAADPAQAEIGFTLARQFQGRGLAFEAVSAVIDYAFDTLMMHRITATVDVRNEASLRLLARLGFRREAHFVESYREGDQWIDEYSFALLNRERRSRVFPVE